jgi:D-3-phosphoglycerate dehydrogenase
MVGRAGVGVDTVDLKAATESGVIVMNAPDGNTVATAELAVALMLTLARHIPPANETMHAGKWEKKAFLGTELRCKTLGIVGLGRVGKAVAKRALAFEMTVIAHDPFVSAADGKANGVEMVTLDALYARSDYISLHAVVSADNKQMINAQSIAKMKKGVRIINDSRGGLIDDAALAQAVKEGKVAGAALDVFTQEPPDPANPLIGVPGIILTPHLGASTVEAQDAVAVQIAEQVLDGLFKGAYQNVVNPDVLKR